AGQYFTPRPLIQAMVDVMAPKPGETVSDPACGTGGFLLAAHDYVVKHNPNLTKPQKTKLKEESFKGWELVQATARLCAMNMLLHGIGSQDFEPIVVSDALAADPGDRFDLVLTNPPFGKKSSTTIVGEEGKVSKERDSVERGDFWTTTSNKQLNFVQHVKTLLKQNGRAAVVVPDNVLFEGGAGETIRRKLLHECDVHTLLRLPTGLFYAQGVKANVLFFDKKPASETPWTKKLWIYDLRTNMHFTLKTDPLTRADLDEFVKCYNPENRHSRKATWSNELDSGSEAGMTPKGKKKKAAPLPSPLPASGERGANGRWRAYSYDELITRDKLSLDIFWLKDDSLADSDNLPAPDVIAQEIVEDLEAALAQFREIAGDLGGSAGGELS
ncbi:MAG: N-6 DNA methylase, partial [Gammaproteobacteria bacterium]|nr:N-6 DNA methylase [Gammaproteobacteria bacterium]